MKTIKESLNDTHLLGKIKNQVKKVRKKTTIKISNANQSGLEKENGWFKI